MKFKTIQALHNGVLQAFNLKPGEVPYPFIVKGDVKISFNESEPKWFTSEYQTQVGVFLDRSGIYVCGWVKTSGDNCQRQMRQVIPALNLQTGEVMFKSLSGAALRDPTGSPYSWLIQSDGKTPHMAIGNAGLWKVSA